MTREEAIKVLENPDVSIGVAARIGQDPEYWRKLKPALDMAISALRQQEHFRDLTKKVEPLTLDELRQMDGEPVWVEPNDSCPPHWRIWSNSEPFDMAVFKAYRRKPEEGTV